MITAEIPREYLNALPGDQLQRRVLAEELSGSCGTFEGFTDAQCSRTMQHLVLHKDALTAGCDDLSDDGTVVGSYTAARVVVEAAYLAHRNFRESDNLGFTGLYALVALYVTPTAGSKTVAYVVALRWDATITHWVLAYETASTALNSSDPLIALQTDSPTQVTVLEALTATMEAWRAATVQSSATNASYA